MSAGINAFVELLIFLMSCCSWSWKSSRTCLNSMFLIMSYTSASKLLSSSFCGGHFLDLKPKLLLSSLSLSRFVLFLSLFCSKKNAFQRIRSLYIYIYTDYFVVDENNHKRTSEQHEHHKKMTSDFIRANRGYKNSYQHKKFTQCLGRQ